MKDPHPLEKGPSSLQPGFQFKYNNRNALLMGIVDKQYGQSFVVGTGGMLLPLQLIDSRIKEILQTQR
jgi:hypothetical protein